MRCGAARKRISDAFGGALTPRQSELLENHLRGCEDCRAYRRQLARVQEEAALRVEDGPDFWAAFEGRLEAKLAAAKAARRPLGVPFAARRRWGVAAAAVMALTGAAVWYALQRPEAAVETAWFGRSDMLDRLVFAAEADPELADRLEGEIRASIEAMTPAPDPDAAALVAADPLFWEGLSADELRAIVAELENETGRGGPL